MATRRALQHTARAALSHLGANGRARMVDVGAKSPTARLARAEATVRLGAPLARLVRRTGATAKGNVIETARIAGILAAKQTSTLIPLCHPLPLDVVDITAQWRRDTLRLEAVVRCQGVTGVEMEALTAVAMAALTVYDMCKAASKGITIGPIRLLEKTGGKSGHWRR